MSRSDVCREDGGQTLVIVALWLAWLWCSAVLGRDRGGSGRALPRVQRAAHAAGLAGVVFLPTNVGGAVTAAKNEAAKNGFTDGVAGVTVTAAPDVVNNKVLGVTVRAPVPTWFARLFGVTSFTARRNGRAEFILPVPMGSPQDYLGIYKLFQSDGSVKDVREAPDASNGPKLASQGFWASVITRAGQHPNGDAYSPAYDGGTNPNAQFDPNGYSYTIEIPSGSSMGEVWLFDATFCAVGHGPSGSYLGTGDHWIGSGGAPVTTTYRLWDTQGTPYTTDDDVLVTDSGSRFSNENQVDRSSEYRGNQSYSDGGFNGSGSADCQNDPDHNDWDRLAKGLVPGTYRMQVTTSAAGNGNTNAENMFGIEVRANGPAGGRVYGTIRMWGYNKLDNATSLFYLAQIPASHAGKTLEIRLFDPGDGGGTAFMRVKKPTPTGNVSP